MARLRWLLVAENGWGLGHVSRQLGIARALRRLRGDDEHLFLTWSEACQLVWREGFPSLKLPSLARSHTARQLSAETQWWLSRSVLQGCASGFRPHAIVVDTFPAGTTGQLSDLLTLPSMRFLVARENRYLQAADMRAVLGRYHLAVSPHNPGDVDIELPEALPHHWVGPILVRNRDDALPRATARALLGLPADGPVCLVTFGGGGNPRYLEAERWVLRVATRFPGWCFALTTAPLLERPADSAALGDNARFVRHYPLAECYAAFDLAISATGSTAYELAHHRVPAILVPDTNQLVGEDHPAKARRIAGQHAGAVVSMGDDAALAAAVTGFSDASVRTAAVAELAARESPDGAQRAARLMVDAMQAQLQSPPRYSARSSASATGPGVADASRQQ